MPYKSDAQRKFFHAAEQRGEILPKTVNKFDKASKGKKLPEYVKPKFESLKKEIEERIMLDKIKTAILSIINIAPFLCGIIVGYLLRTPISGLLKLVSLLFKL